MGGSWSGAVAQAQARAPSGEEMAAKVKGELAKLASGDGQAPLPSAIEAKLQPDLDAYFGGLKGSPKQFAVVEMLQKLDVPQPLGGTGDVERSIVRAYLGSCETLEEKGKAADFLLRAKWPDGPGGERDILVNRSVATEAISMGVKFDRKFQNPAPPSVGDDLVHHSGILWSAGTRTAEGQADALRPLVQAALGGLSPDQRGWAIAYIKGRQDYYFELLRELNAGSEADLAAHEALYTAMIDKLIEETAPEHPSNARGLAPR